MSLYGNVDNAANTPIFALIQQSKNTASSTDRTELFGNTTLNVYGPGRVEGLFGVDPVEANLKNYTASGNYSSKGAGVTAGWVLMKVGTGPIKTISIANGGQNYNTNGFLIITGSGPTGVNGSAANIRFEIANSLNTLQPFSTNSYLNTVSSVSIVNAGYGFTNTAVAIAPGSNSTPATFTFTMGDRVGRIQCETLVAMGSITGDSENVAFPAS